MKFIVAFEKWQKEGGYLLCPNGLAIKLRLLYATTDRKIADYYWDNHDGTFREGTIGDYQISIYLEFLGSEKWEVMETLKVRYML